MEKTYRSFLAKVLAFLMLFTSIPLEGVDLSGMRLDLSKFAFADLDAGGGTLIRKVVFVKQHNGFDTTSAYVEVLGTKLSGINIRFKTAGGYKLIGSKTDDEAGFLRYEFTAQEAVQLTGDMLIAGQEVTTGLSNFPVLNSIDKKTMNTSKYTDGVENSLDNLVLNGANLQYIQTGPADVNGVKASFGKIQRRNFYYDTGSTPPDNDATITLEKPQPPDTLGMQSIHFSKVTTQPNPAGSYETEVSFQYNNTFRFVTDLGLTNLEMFPNTGTKGDTVYFEATNFNDTLTYGVFFLKELNGADDYSQYNKADFVALNKDVDGTKDRLIVTVPNNANFNEQEYYVVITNLLENEVIAEQIVMKPSAPTEPDKFNVIQSGFKPIIENIDPKSGPDTGVDVSIFGRNLISPNLPGLAGSSLLSEDTVTGSLDNKTLIVDYKNGAYTYNGSPATVHREITGQIGKPVTFKKDPGTGQYVITKATTDSLWVRTDIVDDALTDPFKDVILEISTTVTETATGKVYTFKQLALAKDGFKFVPSSVNPTITKITPDTYHTEVVSGMNQLRNETVIRIEGTNFLVHRALDANNNVYTRYPSVFFKKLSTLFTTDYQLAFLPNQLAVPGNPNSQRGIIMYEENNVKKMLMVPNPADPGGPQIPATFTVSVLNAKGEVVTGTEGNDIGTVIVLRMPNATVIEDLGLKNVQVTNPLRGNDDFGPSALKGGAATFTTSNDTMVITSVDPSILAVDGGQDVTVKGRNFDNGIKVFIDGEAITGFTTSIDPTGGEINLKFKAPKHNEGIAQLLLLNEDGYTAVYDLTYVKTFKEGPVLTTFVPTTGTPGTFVTVTGKNYLKPDPAVGSTKGLDAYRLIGTRIFLDGKDVNVYNIGSGGEIAFLAYQAPGGTDLVKTVGATSVYSKYKNDAYAANQAGTQVFALEYDKLGNVKFTNRAGKAYALRPDGAGAFNVFDDAGVQIGTAVISASTTTGAVNTQTIDIADMGGAAIDTLVVTTDNNPIHMAYNNENQKIAVAADYTDSIILGDGTSYYTLTNTLDGKVQLSNGKDNIYTIFYDPVADQFKAQKGPSTQVVTFGMGAQGVNSIILGGSTTLTMYTAYTQDADRKIIGDRTQVITSGLMNFVVPTLSSGGGYKNIAVVNPDTKKDEKTGIAGFLYVKTSTSKPLITEIKPIRGSDDGGYNVRIDGKDFRTGMKVYFGSSLVPAGDTFLAPDTSYVTVRVPKSAIDLASFGVDFFNVPVVVLNPDGGSDFRDPGFTYISPDSNPFITKITPTSGTANGGTIVEFTGREFRFYEPYTDGPGGTNGYDPGIDTFVDLNKNGQWDDYTDPNANLDALKVNDPNIPIFGYYYSSEVFPKVYFAEKEAKIVEFSGDGYIKVITPPHAAGNVEAFVVNNDLGVSNKLTYAYKASTPKMTSIVPNKGRRTGQELKEVNGTELYPSKIRGYYSPATATLPDPIGSAYIREIPDVTALMKFYNIDNLSVARDQNNSGLINNGLASVSLAGGLTVEYRGQQDRLNVRLEENGKIYTRTFENYDDTVMFLPMEMLMADTNNDGTKDVFYTPFGFKDHNGATYSNRVYEYVKVQLVDGMLKVERGYAPKATYDNKTHVQVMTPSYYTVDPVTVTYYNDDGGAATIPFTYINPASEPKIFRIKDNGISADGSYLKVEGAINGNIQIEVLGLDFRKDSKVYIKDKLATNIEFTTAVVDGVTYDVIIAKVPTATNADVDLKYPVIIENPDGGLANSSTLDNLSGPNYTPPGGAAIKLPIYFIYRKPLSGPKILTISPPETSVAANDPAKGLYNWVTITGTDFREGAMVIIGSRGGVPVSGPDNIKISERGTILKFRVPPNLTLGPKDIQVINTDFGIDTKVNGLKIISYPTTEQTFFDAKGNVMQRLSVVGGQTIRIKGTEFYDGAKVVFGGTRSVKVATTTTNPFGLWRDDQYYEIASGKLGSAVKVIDKNTIEVTTPQMDDEGEIIITVINADGGISDGDTKTTVKVPVPSDPVGLKVRLIDETYVELYDYKSEDLDYYEIYYYIGSTEGYKLVENNYRDFKYLDVTNREPYKVLDIPGFEERNVSKDYLWFVIKAVNKFGASSYSNPAYLTFYEIRKLKSVGPADKDGTIGVPEGKDYLAAVKDGMIVINLSPTKQTNLNISLLNLKPQNYPVREVNIPGNRIPSDSHLINIDFVDSKVAFKPTLLNTVAFSAVQDMNKDSTYGNVKHQSVTDQYASTLLSAIPRGQKSVSKIFQLDFNAVGNTEKQAITRLNGTLNLELSYKTAKLTSAQETALAAYRYDATNDRWVKATFSVNKTADTVTIKVSTPGAYMLMTTR